MYLVVLLVASVTANIESDFMKLSSSNVTEKREFINARFHSLGLQSWFEQIGAKDEDSNVVGVLWGKNMLTNSSRFVIVSTSYTSKDASGIAVMLNTAEQLINSTNRCDRENTVAFIAFDQSLNGSDVYLQNFTKFVRNYRITRQQQYQSKDIYGRIQAVVVIEEVKNYHAKNNTQRLPSMFVKNSIKLKDRSKNGNYKGNFVLLYAKNDDKRLLDAVNSQFGQIGLQHIAVNLTEDSITSLSGSSFPIQRAFEKMAVISISDTGIYRNSTSSLTSLNYEFMQDAAKGLRKSLGGLLLEKCYVLNNDALKMYDMLKVWNKRRYTVEQKKIYQTLIKSKLKSLNLKIIEQPYGAEKNQLNIAGLLEGCKNKNKVVLIASHYDSQKNTYGYDDSASGVVTVLRAAELIQAAKERFEYSVMFVFFDQEELGLIGSGEFVKEYLTHNVTTNKNKYQVIASWILDSVLNYNDLSNTQYIPSMISPILPRLYKEMKQNKFAGNAILMVGRKFLDAKNMNSSLTHMTANGVKTYFAEIPNNPALPDFRRSDHAKFWKENITAVFLTDSTEFRGIMKQCYHRWCDTKVQFSAQVYSFISNISYSLSDAVQENAGRKCQPNKTSGSKMSKFDVGLLFCAFSTFCFFMLYVN